MAGDGVGVVTWLKDFNGNNLVINSDGSLNVSTVTAAIAKISGNVVYIGDTSSVNIANIQGGFDDDSSTANRGLVTDNHTRGLDQLSNRWVRIRAVATVSGQGYRLMVTISGERVYDMGTNVVTTPWVALTTTSGGTQLPNVPCIEVTVRSISGNAPVFIGGTGAHAPVSGKGQILYGGEARSYRVDNFNRIQAVGTRAGDMLAIDGYNS